MRICLVYLILLTTLTLLATHNRAGEITYRHTGGAAPTFEINLSMYTFTGSPVDRQDLELEVRVAGALSPISTLTMIRTVQVPHGFNTDTYFNYYELEHGSYTFPGPGMYVLSVSDPTRMGGILNIPASSGAAFYLEDTLNIRDPQFFGYNSSPVLLESPIVFAPQYHTFIYNPGAYDPDGDSMVYELIIPKAAVANDVQGYRFPYDPDFSTPSYPNDFTLDPLTGDLVWDMPTVQGIYNVAFVVREYRDGHQMGTLIRDMQIIVVPGNNNPPNLSEVRDTCVTPGTLLEWPITGTDPDPGQILRLTASGGPFFVGASPATFTTAPGPSPVQGLFSWETSCAHISPVPYTVVFRVADDYRTPANQGIPASDIKSWRIRVVAPPVDNLQAAAGQDNITLTWDNYVCATADTFLGFSIWRKRSCDSTELAHCFTGNLASLGYQQIGGPVQAYTFTDNTIVKGVRYAYRVVAEFARRIPGGSQFVYNRVSGQPSVQVCEVVPSDVPYITQVDVEHTDAANGRIGISWVAPDPDVLDTLSHRAPYRVVLYRHTGFTAVLNPVLVQQFTYASFAALAQTDHSDVGLNTVDGPYNYHLQFFATNTAGQEVEVGVSPNASSVYLDITPVSGALVLNWVEDVPWLNYAYTILREWSGLPGTFDTLARVASPPYTDTSLVNGFPYCYIIRSTGSYFEPFTPDSLINHSQFRCGVPGDTVPPCMPHLVVLTPCDSAGGPMDPDKLKNVLRWTNPVTQCGETAFDRYRIYYAPSIDVPMVLLREVFDDRDTVFVHDGLTSLAGCYVVTAVDTFGNESALLNKVCVDNCPVYRLPSAFSPNGDGQNDRFTPFLPFYFVDRVDMKVFNRWGNLVFATNDPLLNWDGTDIRSGKPLAEGVYFYVCEVYEARVDGPRRLSVPLSGYIQIFRN